MERFRCNWLESVKKEFTHTSLKKNELREIVLNTYKLKDIKWMFSLKDKVPKVGIIDCKLWYR